MARPKTAEHGSHAKYHDGCRCEACSYFMHRVNARRRGVEPRDLEDWIANRGERRWQRAPWRTDAPAARVAPVAQAPRRAFSAMAWAEDAACTGEMRLFFGAPSEHWKVRDRREAQARTICGRCPVLASCREWARSNREYGFWGGESEEERAALGFAPSMPMRNVLKIAAELRHKEHAG